MTKYYGDSVTFSDDGMVDFDQSDMDQYEDLDLQFDIMDQEIEEYHTFLDIMPHEETFDVLGGYGTEELLEDFEFQVLVLDERIRMEEEQYEEFEQFEDFEDFEEDFEERFEEYLEEERYAEEDFEEEFYPEEEIFEEEFVEEIFEDIQEMREEMIEEERLVELEESFEAEETLAEEIPATIAFAEPAKKSDKATRRANIRKLVAGTIAAATGSTDYSGSTAGASASQTGTSASSGGSGSGGNMSISSSPSMSAQFASSSHQKQQVLSMIPSTATSGSSSGGGMSTTSSSSDSSTSISITPMPGMGGGASGAMVDVQVSNLSGEIDTAMSGAMTASEADSIADQIVAANIEAQQEEGESTQEETGKYGDESTLVAYLGYVPGFNAYTSAELPKQTSWYEPRSLDGGVIGDNVLAFYELAGTNMRNMTAMVNSQPNLLGE
jgi:actin-related protein